MVAGRNAGPHCGGLKFRISVHFGEVPDDARAKLVDMKVLDCGGILLLRAYDLKEL